MVTSTVGLNQIEAMIARLSRQDRLLLIERLAQGLREEADSQRRTTEQQAIALLQPDLDETPAERGARMLRQAALNHDRIAASWDAAMEKMGIRGEPIGAEKLQEMLIAEGINPESNEFSRTLIEMREE
jgi:hypothetical protein